MKYKGKGGNKLKMSGKGYSGKSNVEAGADYDGAQPSSEEKGRITRAAVANPKGMKRATAIKSGAPSRKMW
jgi:hypothetical protein